MHTNLYCQRHMVVAYSVLKSSKLEGRAYNIMSENTKTTLSLGFLLQTYMEQNNA